jgi:superfamily I DNA/RNA helicase
VHVEQLRQRVVAWSACAGHAREVGDLSTETDTMPASSAVTPEDEDPVAHAHDLQRERCLLFVACTRARDFPHVSYVDNPSAFLPTG